MRDAHGREIDYMRISLTDRCNLRCRYCMPDALPDIRHDDIMRYEEILRLCGIAVSLGLNKFKLTGGEPLVRKGAAEFVSRLKATPGVRSVTLTTNGVLLGEALPKLIDAGIDGINISIDAVDPAAYARITGFDAAEKVLSAIRACAESGITTKTNTVLLRDNEDQLTRIAALAREACIDVRFIELMPIGCGAAMMGMRADALLDMLKAEYTDLHRSDEKRGNGPAVYYASRSLKGRIGVIAANTHKFCPSCNRIRLTSTGLIKPCLCYSDATDIRALMRGGADDAQIKAALYAAISAKPAAHCFDDRNAVTEKKRMNEIGG